MKRANFRPDDHSRRIDDIIAACSAQRMRAIPASAVGSRTPVFVIGLPRSGTTLVEQILAAHPDVVAAGELQDIPALAYGLPSTLHSNTPFPWCMDELQQDAVNTLSQWYLARLRVHSATAARITDKLPYNFLYLGLITKLFPDAAIIHCVRDPFDTAISCYTTDFIGIQDQAYRLEDLAYYHNEYARLMRHWRSCLEDHTVIPGFGTISNEAQQALEKIAERANES